MFLTKKGLWKTLVIALCYLILGSFCITAGAILAAWDANVKFLFVLGTFCYIFCPSVIVCGLYTEGKGKLINLGNKFVRNELRPREFIKEYQRQRNSTELIVNKPSLEVLQLVTLAYDSLNDKENCLSTVEEMVTVASEKKKTLAKLIKCSVLFSYDMIDEAEVIFTEARAGKQNFICQAITDVILKSDRAMALGDYATVEAYNLKKLAQNFPKLDNLTKLIFHFNLGEIYEKTQNNEKAIAYYQYCVDYGGETAIKECAKSALEKIK